MLAQCEAVQLPSSSALLVAASALQKVLDHGHAQLSYSAEVPITARHFFADLTILTRHALHAVTSSGASFEELELAGPAAPQLQHGDQNPYQTTGAIEISSQPPPAVMQLATTMALLILDDPRTKKASPYPIRDHSLSARLS
ncbi:hypothetical protein [Dietzia alimentaria]|uniref:hypothetical protein n=1 Tax=Dietzia alimentaria TaxID=665550 RepID=UPI00029B2706|nr:hypothetical protein [Dietzia alimentaria]